MASLVWAVTGIILLGAMAAGGIHLWIKRRRESKVVLDPFGDKIRSDLTDFEEKDKEK